MHKINLVYNFGYKWYKNENFYFKGFFFDSCNNLFENEKALNFLEKHTTFDELKNKLETLNGMFSLIAEYDSKMYIAVDKTSTFSLFYSISNDCISVSDNPQELKNNDTKISEIYETEFKATGYVCSKNTIFNNIFRLRPSELVFFEGNVKKSDFFFRFSVHNSLNINSLDAFVAQISVFENAAERLMKFLNGKQALLPLSGGYDSRFIAVLLKNAGYSNVLCFTYGRENNFEIENSKKTAESLGFQWIFIKYDNSIIENYLYHEKFFDYIHYAGAYSSMPFMQEYFAIKYLKDNNLIEENAVFLPGHSGDLIGGSQLIKVVDEKINKSKLAERIFEKKYFLETPQNKNFYLKRINESLTQYEGGDFNKLAYSIFENWDVHEKIPKLIFNSSKVFNIFGYRTYFLFWDNEILSFSSKLPFSEKKYKKLYDKVLTEHYFEPNKVNFRKEIQASAYELFLQKIKNKFKKYLPEKLKRKFLKKNDWINYDSITKIMLEDLKKRGKHIPKKLRSYNSIIINWYIDFIKK